MDIVASLYRILIKDTGVKLTEKDMDKLVQIMITNRNQLINDVERTAYEQGYQIGFENGEVEKATQLLTPILN